MPATVEARIMPSEDKPKTLSVKLDLDVIESARIVATLRNVTMTQLLSGILRPELAKLEREELAKRTKARTSR
jgi:hypothetical protein